MKKKYKIIDSIILAIVLVTILSLSIYSYIIINKIINELKIKFSNEISTILNRKISIGQISPIFFNGIKFQDFYVYEGPLNKKIAYIKTVKVRIKIKDILTRKITVNKSISSIILEDYIVNLEEDQIKNFKLNNKELQNNTNNLTNKTPLTFDIILRQGEVNFQFNNKQDEIQLINEYTLLNLENMVFESDIKINLKKLYGIKLDKCFFNLYSEGELLKNKVSAKGEIYNISFKYYDYPNYLKFNIETSDDLKKIKFKLKDKDKTINLKFNRNYRKYSLHSTLKSFPISDFRLSGKVKFKQQNKKQQYNISLSSKPKNRIFVNIKGDHNKINIEDIKIYLKKNKYVYASGFYNYKKNYHMKFWLNNIKYDNFNLLGKVVLFNDVNNRNKLKLIDFKINKFEIDNFEGEYQYNNHIVFLKTLHSSENFNIKMKNNLDNNKLDLKLKLNNFNSSKFYKLLKINYNEQASVNGQIDLKLYNKKIYIKNRLMIDFINSDDLKRIYLNSAYDNKLLNVNYKILLKDNKIIKINAKSKKKNQLKGHITYDNERNDFLLTAKEKKDHYIFDLIFDKMGKIKVNYYKHNNFNVKLKIDKIIDPQFNTRFIANANAHGNLKFPESIKVQGNAKILNLLKSGKAWFNFKRKKKKLLIQDLNIKIDKNHIFGKGYYDIKNEKINISLNKIKIKGNIEDKKINLYCFFNKNKKFYYNKSSFNLNGFINVKYSLSYFRIFGDINLFKFKYNNIIIPEVYTVFIYHNNNFEFKKLNCDYNDGKIILDVKSFYKKKDFYCGETIVRVKDVKQEDNEINAKIYTKFCLGQKVDLKLKILNFAFNDLEFDDIYENVSWYNNTLTFNKINNDGLYGNIKFSKKKKEIDLTFDINHSQMKIKGYKKKNTVKYDLLFHNIDSELLEDASPFVNKARGILNSRLYIKGNVNQPIINGYINGNNLYFKFDNFIKKLEDFNIQVTIKDNIAKIMKCKGVMGKGQFSLLGTILLKKYEINHFDLFFKTLDEEGVFIEKKENDLAGNLTAQLQIKGTLKKLGIGGQVVLNDFDFTWPLEESDSDDTSVELDAKIDFNLDIYAGKNVNYFQNVNNIDILVKEGGKFNLKGDLSAKHKVVGKMEAEKGTLDYFGTTFTVENAYVDFSKHYHENVPWIKAKAEADVKGINDENVTITMRVDGRADNDLAPKLTSYPALKQREIFLLLEDSTLYVSDKPKSQKEEQEEINDLIKVGFIQIFNSTYRTRFVTPLGRKAKRFLGLDLFKIRSQLVRNLLEPKLHQLEENNDKTINPFADTQLSVGKYVTDDLLIKYSVSLKENDAFSHLYYEQKFGFEWKIYRSLNFEWMYHPLYYDDYSQPLTEQKYKLEWKKKISF